MNHTPISNRIIWWALSFHKQQSSTQNAPIAEELMRGAANHDNYLFNTILVLFFFNSVKEPYISKGL